VSAPSLSFADLPRGSNVLIDANVFIYALDRRSVQCRQLLDRCAREEISGMTTVEVINEVCHRLMLAEAVAAGDITRPAAILMKRKPAALIRLTRYWPLTESIFGLNLAIIPLDENRIRRAAEIGTQYALLTNDSMLLAAAREYGVRALASHDSDF
jgi:predicted nucleic acid-binding protein